MKLSHRLFLVLIFGVFSLNYAVSGIYKNAEVKAKHMELAKEKRFDCIGRVLLNEEPAGSCTLIKENFVITALHVIEECDIIEDTVKIDNGYTIYYNPINERFTQANKLKVKFENNIIRNVKKIHFYDTLRYRKDYESDIVLLELESPIRSIQLPQINDKFDELGSVFIGAGYGASGEAGEPETIDFKNEKIAGYNTIDSLAGIKINNEFSQMYYDFDSKDYDNCNKMGSPIPLEYEYITTGGDSGCGIFREKENELQFIGVLTGGGIVVEQFNISKYFCQTSNLARVSAYYPWISSILNN